MLRALALFLSVASTAFADGLNLPQIGDSAPSAQTLPLTGTDGFGGDGPQQIITAYLTAMLEGNADPDLPIYSAKTRAAAGNWQMSAQQMGNVARTYAECSDPQVFLQGRLAVQRYPASQRVCAPFFLLREDGAWVLDLTAMGDIILFNTENEWHFSGKVPVPYAFAFGDWRLDANGFPFE